MGFIRGLGEAPMLAFKIKMAPSQIPVLPPTGLVTDPFGRATAMANNSFRIDDEAKSGLRSANADVYVLVIQKNIGIEPDRKSVV